MHNKLQSVRVIMLLAMAVAICPTVGAAESATDERETTEQHTQPEYRARPQPADTFEPSEDVSEDFAVPFPVDI